MKTEFITARDGQQIAYDVTGEGPAVMLLHGGGVDYSRQALRGSNVRVHILNGLNHAQELKEIDQVFPVMFGFTVAA